jgi:uncharacterized protein YbjT (DUF2867 family)
MIIVTGANGGLGRLITERLLERVPSERIGVSVRDPEKARELEDRGVRVRQGDFGDPASLADAFEGARQVLVVHHHRTAVEAAAAAGAERILYTSHMGSNPSSPFAPMRDHAATEAALRESGVPFTSLRNGFYASSAAMLLGHALETGELAAPEDGPVAWTAHADLAEAAALALTGEGLDGTTPALTGPEALDLADIAAIATRLTGREIRRVVVSDADYRASLLARGLPAAGADLLLGLFAAIRQGQFTPVDPTLGRLLGRPTTALAEFLKTTITPTG